MDLTLLYDDLSTQVLKLAISTIRLAIAFLIIPLFSDDLIPPLIRNSIFIALAIVVVTLQPEINVQQLSAFQWLNLFAKEAFVGLTIGFFFGIFLWAFEAAGTIVDTQIGASMAMIYDPISGHDVTLYGDFMGRWVNFLFLSVGGLLFVTGAVLDSYIIWPIDQAIPDFQQAALILFENEFSRFATLTLMIASPIMIVVFTIDMSMGLINRFAKRLDILFISLAVKGLVALLLITLLVPTLVEILINELGTHRESLERIVERVLGTTK